MNNTTQPQYSAKTVTIPTDWFVRALLRREAGLTSLPAHDEDYHEKVAVDEHIATLLKHLDPGGEILHLEPPNTGINNTNSWHLYQRLQYLRSKDRYTFLTERQKETRDDLDARESAITEVAVALHERYPAAYPYPSKDTMAFARALVMTKNTAAIDALTGLDISHVKDHVTLRTKQVVSYPDGIRIINNYPNYLDD